MKFNKGEFYRGKISSYDIDEIVEITENSDKVFKGISRITLNDNIERGVGVIWDLGIYQEDKFFTIERVTLEDNPEYFL